MLAHASDGGFQVESAASKFWGRSFHLSCHSQTRNPNISYDWVTVTRTGELFAVCCLSFSFCIKMTYGHYESKNLPETIVLLRGWLLYFPLRRIYLISEEAKKKDVPLNTSGMRGYLERKEVNAKNLSLFKRTLWNGIWLCPLTASD